MVQGGNLFFSVWLSPHTMKQKIFGRNGPHLLANCRLLRHPDLKILKRCSNKKKDSQKKIRVCLFVHPWVKGLVKGTWKATFAVWGTVCPG